MRTTASFLPYTPIACPVGVTAPALTIAEASTVKPCTLQDYCGMATFSDPSQPNQWYRIFLAPFLHAGAVHVLLCSWLLFMTASPVEETYGSRLVAVVYVMSGVGGFLFSALFSSISRKTPGKMFVI